MAKTITKSRVHRTTTGKSGRPVAARGDATPPETRPRHAGKRAAGGTRSEAPAEGASDAATNKRSRSLSQRATAPWTARHAAKHAQEAAERNAAPPPPGSARATLRTPAGADELKERIRRLHADIQRVESLRRSLATHFLEIGQLLQDIRGQRLYEAKGYASFEAFAERETGLGRSSCVQLARIAELFRPESVGSLSFESLAAALQALDDAESKRPASGYMAKVSRVGTSSAKGG